MTSVELLSERFQARGLKLTPQRRSIFRALEHAADHPTAEAVYATVASELPSISLRTVYQTLNELAGIGALHPLDVGTGATRFDLNVEPHHHLVCDDCGQIVDVHADVDRITPEPTGQAAGFEVTATEIVFRGRCAPCAGAAT